jgi:hypothetical protein
MVQVEIATISRSLPATPGGGLMVGSPLTPGSQSGPALRRDFREGTRLEEVGEDVVGQGGLVHRGLG